MLLDALWNAHPRGSSWEQEGNVSPKQIWKSKEGRDKFLTFLLFLLHPLCRFLFILLGPSGRAKSYNEIGRAIATLMVDDVSGNEKQCCGLPIEHSALIHSLIQQACLSLRCASLRAGR